jgi:CheY-like chemotaxis protein
VHANETQLTQVLLNLAANACYAMRDRSRRELRVRTWLDTRGADGMLVLEVSDTGLGMDEIVRARVFDPFFTTKPVGEGSGLGLAVVHGVVKAHDGTIHVESEPEVGTTVQVRLPVCAGAARDRSDRTPLRSHSVRGHVLVVDDERMVLTALTRVLERAGFTVSAFDRPAAALGFLETRSASQEFSGAVLDYSMPEMRGDELARQLTQHGFRAPIILYSGNTTDVGDVSEHIARVVEKPATGAELVALLSGTLRAA